MAYETKLPRQASSSMGTEDFSEGSEVFAVAPTGHHLTSPLTSSGLVPHPPVMSLSLNVQPEVRPAEVWAQPQVVPELSEFRLPCGLWGHLGGFLGLLQHLGSLLMT